MSRSGFVSRLAYFGQTLGLGGAETFLSDLLGELGRRGIGMTAYTNHQLFGRLLADNQVPTRHIPWVLDVVGNWRGLLKAAVAAPFAFGWYWQALRREKEAEVVLVSGFAEKLILSWWCRLQGKPVVWIEFAPLETLFSKFWGLPGWWYRWSARLPELVIVPTAYTLGPLIEQTGIPADKIRVVPCGRNLTKEELRFRQRARQTWGRGGAAKKWSAEGRVAETAKTKTDTLVCVSRLERGKGQDLLIGAMPIVLKHYPDTRLRIVGEGDFGAELERLVVELGLTDQVTLTGRVPDALAELKAATVCVFPSVWALEGFGMVTIEAMALGKPIVAFNTGPTPYLVEHRRTALLAQPASVDDLAVQVLRLLGDASLRDELGRRARRRFQQHYRIGPVADQYLEVLAEARRLFEGRQRAEVWTKKRAKVQAEVWIKKRAETKN